MSSTTDPKILGAVRVYLDRQAKISCPDGKCDSGGRWYPSETEHQPCCRGIRSPSRAWPRSLQDHCRSACHVSRLFDVDELELTRAARALKHLKDGEAA